jgi:hypothetical protein
LHAALETQESTSESSESTDDSETSSDSDTLSNDNKDGKYKFFFGGMILPGSLLIMLWELILHILIQRYAKAAVVLSMVILSQRGNK